MTLGETLRAARERLGWSLYEAEARSGISRGALLRYERGDRVPGGRALGRLAEALDLDAGELVRLAAAKETE